MRKPTHNPRELAEIVAVQALSFIASDTERLGVFLAEVDEEARMLRSNSVQFTGLEGTPRYHNYMLRSGHKFRVERDGGKGYRDRLAGMGLPLAYLR